MSPLIEFLLQNEKPLPINRETVKLWQQAKAMTVVVKQLNTETSLGILVSLTMWKILVYHIGCRQFVSIQLT